MDPYRAEYAADLAHHLKGLRFPMTKQDMIRHALKQGADQDVMHQLGRLQDKEYGSLTEALKEIGKTA